MPTVRQKKAFKEVLNGSTISGAMLKAGYSATTASTTGKLTNTQGWRELMDLGGLSDEQLLKKHTAQLNASKHTKLYFDIDDSDELIKEVCEKLGVELLYIKINKDKSGITANVKAPDFFYRDLALDKAYKVKGKYNDNALGVPTGSSIQNLTQIIINVPHERKDTEHQPNA